MTLQVPKWVNMFLLMVIFVGSVKMAYKPVRIAKLRFLIEMELQNL